MWVNYCKCNFSTDKMLRSLWLWRNRCTYGRNCLRCSYAPSATYSPLEGIRTFQPEIQHQRSEQRKREGPSGLLIKISLATNNWFLYFCPQVMKMVSTGIDWFLSLINDTYLEYPVDVLVLVPVKGRKCLPADRDYTHVKYLYLMFPNSIRKIIITHPAKTIAWRETQLLGCTVAHS